MRCLQRWKKKENEDKLVNAIPRPKDVKLTFVKKMLNKLKKKNNEIFIMNKTFCLINYDNLLINIEMFKS